MSFRNNGRKRNPKYVLSALFMLLVGIIVIILAQTSAWGFHWNVIGAIVIFLGIIMFKNANEL